MTVNILYYELVKSFCEIIIAINRLFTFNGINCGQIFSKVTENPAKKTIIDAFVNIPTKIYANQKL